MIDSPARMESTYCRSAGASPRSESEIRGRSSPPSATTGLKRPAYMPNVPTVAEAMGTEGDLIAPLKAELELHAGRTVLAKANEAQSKSVTIMGDKSIPYSLLRKVMYTAARANYSDVSFAVSQKAGKA